MLDQSFHFIVVVWGERFCDYLLEYCLPSLLSPGNLPALETRPPSKFLIATRPDDWERMRQTAIFQRMAQYVTPIFIEIPPCPEGRSGCEHMGIGHKLCCEMSFQEKAYAMILTPDAMLSDGTIAHLQMLANEGAELVLAVALRFGEEPFLGNLHKTGAIPSESRKQTGRPLVLSGRTLVSAAIDGFHSESLRYEWNAPYFNARLPSATWWRVPQENGIVVHSLSWAPLLMSYKAVDTHDTSTLDHWTIDGDYVHKNFNDAGKLRIITDSDFAFLASWGPMDDRPHSLKSVPYLTVPWIGQLLRKIMFREAFYSPIFDPLKREIFYKPVYWHSRPLNKQWDKTEAQARKTLRSALKRSDFRWAILGYRIITIPLRFILVLSDFWTFRDLIVKRLAEICTGDVAAARRVGRRLTQFADYIIGK